MCKQSWLWPGCLSMCMCTNTHSAGQKSVSGARGGECFLPRLGLKSKLVCSVALLPFLASFSSTLFWRIMKKSPEELCKQPMMFQVFPFLAAVLRAVWWGLLIWKVVRRGVAWRDHCRPEVAGSRLGIVWQAGRVREHIGALQVVGRVWWQAGGSVVIWVERRDGRGDLWGDWSCDGLWFRCALWGRSRCHVFEASQHCSSNDAQEEGHDVEDRSRPQEVVEVYDVLAAFHICIFMVASH